jgi:ribosomal protein L29
MPDEVLDKPDGFIKKNLVTIMIAIGSFFASGVGIYVKFRLMEASHERENAAHAAEIDALKKEIASMKTLFWKEIGEIREQSFEELEERVDDLEEIMAWEDGVAGRAKNKP